MLEGNDLLIAQLAAVQRDAVELLRSKDSKDSKDESPLKMLDEMGYNPQKRTLLAHFFQSFLWGITPRFHADLQAIVYGVDREFIQRTKTGFSIEALEPNNAARISFITVGGLPHRGFKMRYIDKEIAKQMMSPLEVVRVLGYPEASPRINLPLYVAQALAPESGKNVLAVVSREGDGFINFEGWSELRSREIGDPVDASFNVWASYIPSQEFRSQLVHMAFETAPINAAG
jgi:hypothetical protein